MRFLSTAAPGILGDGTDGSAQGLAGQVSMPRVI